MGNTIFHYIKIHMNHTQLWCIVELGLKVRFIKIGYVALQYVLECCTLACYGASFDFHVVDDLTREGFDL